MNICEQVRAAFPEKEVPDLNGYYSAAEEFMRIFRGSPQWLYTKKSGLYSGGARRISLLNSAKVLCDRLSSLILAEPPHIRFSDSICGEFVQGVLDRTGFFSRLPHILAYAFAGGGCAFRPYLSEGKVAVDWVFGDGFVPLAWNGGEITECCFRSAFVRGGAYYTLFELHESEDSLPAVTYRLFKSKIKGTFGEACPLQELFPKLPERVIYNGLPNGCRLFSFFRPCVTNNMFPDLPLGLSVFGAACDTLKALDIAFDSFSREFILGKKRIIVPSACVQTVVDIASGEQRKFFDADDEAYVALKCDEERDLKITDNTVELRIDEHVQAINALLNLLCFQTGLSSGTFSFDSGESVKTATEIISRDSKTAVTVRGHVNLLTAALCGLFREIALLGAYCGQLDMTAAEALQVHIDWRDGIITDDNTLLDNTVKLVGCGLKSKLSAIMDIQKCGEEEARAELERIAAERI